jgi:methylated-DNA-[protein]-cysteine S-methyltransferase
VNCIFTENEPGFSRKNLIMKYNPNNKNIHTSVIRHRIATVVVRGMQKLGEAMVTEILVGTKAKKVAEGLKPSPRDPLLTKAVRLLGDYLDGSDVDFSAIQMDMEGLTSFQIAVLRAAQGIPYGSTASYSGLAKAAGHPRAVRAAGTVMARNPFPIIIPCHRVIRSDGSPGAYSGDWDGEDAAIKRALLQLEKDAR